MESHAPASLAVAAPRSVSLAVMLMSLGCCFGSFNNMNGDYLTTYAITSCTAVTLHITFSFTNVVRDSAVHGVLDVPSSLTVNLDRPTPNATGSFNTNWADYPGGVEYFEVYMGPITTLYSQVLRARLGKRLRGRQHAVFTVQCQDDR